jgi:hypothetical protein
VWGDSRGLGVVGTATQIGVYGLGGYFGVMGICSAAGGSAVHGTAGSGQYAGSFDGDVYISGTLTKGGGGFKIDHPLDPAKKHLCHSFVESPDMKNLYDGVVVLNAKGEATVKLPDWFKALNQDFRYQLTPIGAPAPNLHIAQEIAGNQFKIAGGRPRSRVSWQVTGIRHDAFAKAHRIAVEKDKPKIERQHYLHPELYGRPPQKSVEWARNPEEMRRLTQMRQKAKRPRH